MNDHHVDNERTEEVDLMTSNPRRSARLGSRSSSTSSMPIPGGSAIAVKIQALNGTQLGDEEIARSGGSCVNLEQSCEEVFTSDLVVTAGAAGCTSSAQDPAATAPKPFPLLAGTPVTVSGEVFYEGTDMLVVRVTWRGKEFTGTLIRQGQGHWAPTRMGMVEEGDAEAEMIQDRSEEPPVRRRRRRGPRSRDKANGDGKTSPSTSTGRKRGRPAKVKKQEEDEEEERKSKESEQGESIGEEDKEIINATEETWRSLRSKARSTELTTPTPTKELVNASQPSPADSSRAESPSELPEYYECPEQECPRKYKHMKSLKHHLACAHQGIRRPSLKRKNATITELLTDNEDKKGSEIMQSPASKKTKADLLSTTLHKGKASMKHSSLVEHGSGNSEKEENEAHEDENEASEEVKQVRRTRRKRSARQVQKPRNQSDEDEKEDVKEFGASETSTPEKKETIRHQFHSTEESCKRDDIEPRATVAQQPRISHTLGLGNSFTIVSSPSSRAMASGSPVKGSHSAALKISNNQIHGSSGASGNTSESQLGQTIHQSSLTPALERMTVGQRDASDTAVRAHLPTEKAQSLMAELDTGKTMGLQQCSKEQLSPPVEDRSPLNAKRKTRVSGADKVPDKSHSKAESTGTIPSNLELLARLGGMTAFNNMTDNRLKVDANSSSFYPPSAIPFGHPMDIWQRNGSLVFGGRQPTSSSSKDMQLGIPSSSSAPPHDHQPSLGMGAFPHGAAIPFLTAEALSRFPNIPGYPLTRDIPYPIALGIPGFGMVAEMNVGALSELNKARGAST